MNDEKIIKLFDGEPKEKVDEYKELIEEIKAMPDDRLTMLIMGRILQHLVELSPEPDKADVLISTEAMARSCKTTMQDLLRDTDLLK